MIPKNAFAVSVVARASSPALSPAVGGPLRTHTAVHALASVAAQHLVSVLGRGSPLDQTTADLD